ncbi:MAG: metalloprotease TldD [Alphaproteobacteria bacterium]|jgi:TldD protein|nr:metalloprotease TldD [Alphaproteobacteria bacterium]MDG1887208.1 metalloprotease TldD [Alphaproteobacteria bacterium]|tara:strand:- start:182 stop:1615 length:1434 start_codon:yes stop_codon:yes gene_type:complete
MSDLEITDDIFFNQSDLNSQRIQRIVDDTIGHCDDGELFIEYRQSEAFGFDDGRLKTASFDTSQGFGLRGIVGETRGYAHASELSEPAIRRAAETVKTLRSGNNEAPANNPVKTNAKLYTNENPILGMGFSDKVKLLQDIDSYARSKDPRIKQVSASLSASWQAVQIMRANGHRVADIRPLVRLNVSVVVADGEKMESGGTGIGGRMGYNGYIGLENWQAQVDEAFRLAMVNLEAIPAPAGEMDVVLGPGWPGVMLHEAVGHGLEGDFNRKKTSTFTDMIGKRVASPGVTVIDDGTIPDRRGSITIDDEGTPSRKNVLIEDGILVGYMQDRQNARLMDVPETGNGRRESYAHHPMPRMTNTYMLGGDKEPEEILKSVKNGLYAVNFSGGQVDIVSGKFVFAASEAYLIENGEITRPVKGATLIGNGPEAMNKISMIGNDMKLDQGVGTCGKDGQGVPVGVGQPTLKMNGVTIGGTAV